MTTNKRIITTTEETAYRLFHSDFHGLNTQEIAKVMGVSRRRVQQLLASVERKAPQLFGSEKIYPRGKVSRYDPGMDPQVKQKF